MSETKINKKTNPLGVEPKREKSGSDTFRKYNYQYHWAFFRMLDDIEQKKDFVLFIEEHEDVTIADSVDPEKATFEFNQIKETSRKHTIASLTKKERSGSLSLIEKLAKSCSNKTYSDKIVRVNFVSTGGYSFDLHKEGFNFEVISSGKLSDVETTLITKSLSEIEGSSGLQSKLAFIIPELPAKGFDLAVEGKVSTLISKLAPGLKYDSNSIYSYIIRDLNRKGENSFDYSDWDQAVQKKAITHNQLASVIEKYISRKPDEYLIAELAQILKDEYSLGFMNRRKITNGFNRYYQKKTVNRDGLINGVSRDIAMAIERCSNEFLDVKELEVAVIGMLEKDTLSFFQTKEDLTGAFLYELLKGVDVQ